MAQESGFTVRGMAPTGAAAKQLTLETGVSSETVSMFQIKERQLEKDIVFAKQYAPDFQRKPELWVVDESSFLSQRQKAQLDNMSHKAGAKVVYLGDVLQLQGVEAGKPFELAQKDGMTTAYMTEINRQKTPELQDAVGIITGRDQLGDKQRLTQVELNNNARAFAHMDQAGMVKEVKSESKGSVIDELVSDYLKLSATEREGTIVITAFNKDRVDINNAVRVGLTQEGVLSKSSANHEILVSKGWTRAMIKESQYYRAGDVVRFGRDYKQVDAKNGEYARVVSVDLPSGTVNLRKENGTELTWKPKKHNKVEVYNSEKRELAKGDLIRITRGEGEFKNGETARISSLDGPHATLEVRHGKEAPVSRSVNLIHSRHWDHAYATTVHASQGATQYRTIFHIRAPETENERQQERALENMAKVFGNRSFYVGTTRASHELRIYTNDKAVAAKAVAGRQDKTSAVETIRHHEKESISPPDTRDIQR
jgi:ATP-dependent exoDNAse (exonuclease V) alpha subunit